MRGTRSLAIPVARPTTEFSPAAILATLVARKVRFVLIGGLAADAHGVTWATFDVDIVIEPAEDNYVALVEALNDLDAVFDTAHQPPIRPDVTRLRSATGALLCRTERGRLDMLKDAGGETYESLTVDALKRVVAGSEIEIASLAAIARMKRAANRRKDLEVLPAIEAALAKANLKGGS